MAKIGRNALCPCGSEKKYKKCCLSIAEAAKVQEMLAARQERGQWQKDVGPALAQVRSRVEELMALELDADDRRLDDLSNGVLDLIKQGRFDEALASCEELRCDYPDVIDWLDRSAMVHEARGDSALAADFYRRALAFTEQPDQQDGFDEDGRDFLRRKIAEAEARATPPS